MENLLTLKEVAEITKVSVRTIARWIKSGALVSLRTSTGKRGRYRIDPADLYDFLYSRKLK